MEAVVIGVFLLLTGLVMACGWHSRTVWVFGHIVVQWRTLWHVYQRRTGLPLAVIVAITLWEWYGRPMPASFLKNISVYLTTIWSPWGTPPSSTGRRSRW